MVCETYATVCIVLIYGAAVKKRRSEPMFYQCQVFLTAGEVHRVTIIELDEQFNFLGRFVFWL